MERTDYIEASRYWSRREAELKRMPERELFKRMEGFLQTHNTCALATGSGTFVRCTPVEYEYFGGRLWIVTEGGLKFAALKDNKKVSIAVYEPYRDFDSIKGLQITGTAEVAEPGSGAFEEYGRHRAKEGSGAPLPQGLYLLAVVPEKIEAVFGEFLELGYSARQSIEFGGRRDRCKG